MSEAVLWPEDWDVLHPNAYVGINAVRFSLDRELRRLSFAELGILMDYAMRAAVEGRWYKLDPLPWVECYNAGPHGRESIPPSVRAAVLSEGLCRVCGSTDRLEVDHIVPWSRGGSSDHANLQPLCLPCNRSKRAKTMEEWLG